MGGGRAEVRGRWSGASMHVCLCSRKSRDGTSDEQRKEEKRKISLYLTLTCSAGSVGRLALV
jgi:hypothetical protein